ncbi:MAG: hypothetical protein RRY12_02840 [Cloacibacillus sp.]
MKTIKMRGITAAVAALLLLAAGPACAWQQGPQPWAGMGPGPVRLNPSMPIMHGGYYGPGAGNPWMAGGPGPAVYPAQQTPYFGRPGWMGHTRPYPRPYYYYNNRNNGSDGGKLMLGLLGGMILGGIISNNS